MPAETPAIETPKWSGDERRKGGNHRNSMTPADHAGEIVWTRLEGKRPENLDEILQGRQEDVKQEVAKLFNRLEGKLDPEKVDRLKAGFESSVAVWEAAGLFTEERLRAGYVKPDFARDYLSFVTPEILAMMEEGKGLDKGYDRPVLAPMDLPLHRKDAEKPSYFTVLAKALLNAYNGTAGGKAPETLLIGPEKRVIGPDKINLNAILWRWERYLKKGVVHNPQRLDPKNHGGMTEAEVLEGLQGVERKTGGVMRLERTRLVMPGDVGKATMSPQDLGELLADESNPLPKAASVQDIKQAMAFVIDCLETQGWIPDFFDLDDIKNSRVALALDTYVPDEGASGAVAALAWDVDFRRFNVDGRGADVLYSSGGVRPGVRMG